MTPAEDPIDRDMKDHAGAWTARGTLTARGALTALRREVDNLRMATKALVYDLEATKRERDDLVRIVESDLYIRVKRFGNGDDVPHAPWVEGNPILHLPVRVLFGRDKVRVKPDSRGREGG
jgi:hypothetical protein